MTGVILYFTSIVHNSTVFTKADAVWNHKLVFVLKCCVLHAAVAMLFLLNRSIKLFIVRLNLKERKTGRDRKRERQRERERERKIERQEGHVVN